MFFKRKFKSGEKVYSRTHSEIITIIRYDSCWKEYLVTRKSGRMSYVYHEFIETIREPKINPNFHKYAKIDKEFNPRRVLIKWDIKWSKIGW